MGEWIAFDEGRYLAERAMLVTADDTLAVMLTDAVIEVYLGRRGGRQLKGYATVANHLLVDLLDETDEIDLVLDLTGTFKYRLPNPRIRSGKLFTPDVRSTLHFIPTRPWQKIPENAFDAFLSGLRFL